MANDLLRAHSRKEWNAERTLEAINAGSLQRIADATEKMAASYDAMRIDRDSWKARYEERRVECSRLALSIRSLRGVITRLKRQAVDRG